MPRYVQSFIGFALAAAGFVLVIKVFPSGSTPRDQWVEAFIAIILTIAAASGGIGAIFGNFWPAFTLGLIIPIAAVFALALLGMWC